MRPPESFVAQPIRSLQTMLRVIAENDPSLPSLIPDGIYAQETIEAVNAFQHSRGIPATGITDQATWEAIVVAYEDALIKRGIAPPVAINMAVKCVSALPGSRIEICIKTLLNAISSN